MAIVIKIVSFTSLIISHDIAGVQYISDRVAMLYHGKIVHSCEAKKIWQQENEVFNQFIQGKVSLK